MELAVFYILATVFGYFLMFLNYRFPNNKKVYFVAAVIALVILINISQTMGEPYDYIFDQDNYTNVAPWLYYVVVVVLIFPAIYLGYPLLLVYRYIINMLIELCEEAMNLPLREEHANQDTKAKRSRHQEQSSNE